MDTIKTDTAEQKQERYVQVHTLTHSERDKLIKEKLERARAYHEAWRKREALLERR